MSEKHRVEEKQRASRKERAAQNDEWQPRWFKQQVDEITGEPCWVYAGGYWESRAEGKWDNVPDIFS